VPIVLKSGSLNVLEPYESVQVCNGIALPLTFTINWNCWFHPHSSNLFLNSLHIVEKIKFVVESLCSSVSQIFISDTSVQILVKLDIKDLMSLVCVCVCVCGRAHTHTHTHMFKTAVEFYQFSVKWLVKQEICTLYKMQTSS
jgi:hypothetical protein